ncbi:Flagellar hook-length control protein FliK [compost metagenome]
MSGITPVLDTLLHQVLGRRVDIPLPKDLNQPAAPVLPVEGARPLHSDSRLDARNLPQAQVAVRPQQAAAAQVSLARDAAQGAPSVAPGGTVAPSSTITSFSAAARAIADLLQRFPVPPSAIAPAAPLLAEAPREAPAATLIATRLQQSIQHSGLFYESHVARWFRGEFPLEALRREPQMQAAPRSGESATPATLQAGAPASSSGVQGAVAPPLPPSEPAPKSDVIAADSADILDAGAAGALATRAEVAGLPQESLSALLRQQLELLAQPQLRWEGNVWAGVFMGLSIEAPPLAERQLDEEGEAAGREQTAEGEWRVRLGLRLADLGALEAAISLQGERLALTLQTDSVSLRRYFEGSRAELQASLEACGFSCVRLQLLEADAAKVEDGRG